MYDIVLGRNKEDMGRFGTSGTINIGKHYVKMGQTTSLSNNILMDVAKSHIVFICGKRGSGKSYSMGVIAESMSDLPKEMEKNISIIILDTMGIYWTMKYPNKKDKELLDEWGIEAKPLNVSIFTPIGYYKKYKEQDIPTDFPFSIKTSNLSAYEWSETFGIDLNDSTGILIERAIETLKESGRDYDIDDIVKTIQKDDRSAKEVKDAVENRFLAAKHWGLFSKEGTLLEDLVIPGQITVLDVSCYSYSSDAKGLRALVIGLVAQKLFAKRMAVRKSEEYKSIYRETHLIDEDQEEEKEPLVWLIIDEAQTLPGLFPVLRSIIDAKRHETGRYILLGSVNPALVKHISESLAGRVGIVELTPFLFSEIADIEIDFHDYWLKGGFPDALH